MSTYLPENYAPTQWDVLCGRGLQYLQHPGNERFRLVVQRHMSRYKAATTKLEKSIVVIDIINEVRSTTTYSANETCFIRFDHKLNRWYYINRAAAKKKVGQTIREMINQRDPKKSYVNKLKRRINYHVRKSSSMTPSSLDDPEVSFSSPDSFIAGEAPDCSMSTQSSSEMSYGSLEEVEKEDPVLCIQPEPKVPIEEDFQKAAQKRSNSEVNVFCGSDIRVAAEHISVELTSPFDWFSSCPDSPLQEESDSSDKVEWFPYPDTLSPEDCEGLSDSLATLFE